MKALLGLDLLPLDTASVERSPQPAAQTSLEKTIAYHSELEGQVGSAKQVARLLQVLFLSPT